MLDIIAYVEVEETPVRWNHDGSMFMTEDFRWYISDGEMFPEADPADYPQPVIEPRKCEKCGSHISYVGKGRPRKYCGEC